MLSFYDLMKYAKTGIASPDMTGFDKLRARAAFGGYPVSTITGVPPISFLSDGTPLISWSISGNGKQTGTPTPDNPIQPQFVGVRTANLCQLYKTGYYIDSSGTERENVNFSIYSAKIPSSGDYTLSCTYSGGGNTTVRIHSYSGGSWQQKLAEKDLSSVPITITATSGIDEIRISINNGAQNVMLNAGSTALPYEPYGWAVKITCAGQTVPVYLGLTQTVRRVRKLVLDGTETWNRAGSSHGYFTILPDVALNAGAGGIISSHYQPAMTGNDGTIRIGNSKVETLIYDNYTSVADWKAYLAAQYAAGTPVTVWYVLATPETAIVNEPLCKIGDYADELSSADAGVTIPTANGQNTLTVDTELQPSAVSVTGHIQLTLS